MGLFSKVKQDTSIERSKDVIGGGFKAMESDIYAYEVVQAYAHQSDSGAHAVVFEFNLTVEGADKPRKMNETIYFTNKVGETFWAKEDRKGNLPGFDLVDDLVMNATEGAMGILSDDLDVVEKTIQVKRDGVMTPVVVQVIQSLIGSTGKLAILKEIVDETKKSDATGLYEATGGTKEQNTITKVFGESGHTINELVNEIEQPVFQAEWLDVWKGKTKTSTKGAGKTPVAGKAALTGTAAPKKASLFKK